MKTETRAAKSEKVQTRVEIFFLIFYAKQRRLKRWGKTVGLAVIPYCFTDSLCSLHVYTSLFPDQNYKSRSIEYNLNWCWHHAPHLKKKALPVFENLVTTSRTTTKVVSCLKISLTSWCVVVRTSSLGSRLRQFFILPHLSTPRTGLSIHGRNSSTTIAEEFYYSFYLV